jgi:hypothetical protein
MLQYPLNDLLTPTSLESCDETESSTLPDLLLDIEKRALFDGNDPKDIGRIVLVDHSSSGQSVDGFKLAFEDMVRVWHQRKGKSEDIVNQAVADFSSKFGLINVIDYNRRLDAPRPCTKYSSTAPFPESCCTLSRPGCYLLYLAIIRSKRSRRCRCFSFLGLLTASSCSTAL